MNSQFSGREDTNKSKKRKVDGETTLLMYNLENQQILPSMNSQKSRIRSSSSMGAIVGKKRKRSSEKTYEPSNREDVIEDFGSTGMKSSSNVTQFPNINSQIEEKSLLVRPPPPVIEEDVESVGLDDEEEEEEEKGELSTRASTNLDDTGSSAMMSEDLGDTVSEIDNIDLNETKGAENKMTSEKNEDDEDDDDDDDDDGIDEEYDDPSELREENLPKFQFNVNDLYLRTTSINQRQPQHHNKIIDDPNEEVVPPPPLRRTPFYNFLPQPPQPKKRVVISNHHIVEDDFGVFVRKSKKMKDEEEEEEEEEIVQSIPIPEQTNPIVEENTNINNRETRRNTYVSTDFLFEPEIETPIRLTPVDSKFGEFPSPTDFQTPNVNINTSSEEDEEEPIDLNEPFKPSKKTNKKSSSKTMIDEDEDEDEEEEEEEEIMNLNVKIGVAGMVDEDEDEIDESDDEDEELKEEEEPDTMNDEFELLLVHPNWKTLSVSRIPESPRDLNIEKLFHYQRQGIQFMMNLEESNIKGGILADQLGLGKTIMILGLLCLKPTWVNHDPQIVRYDRGPILIITPQIIQKQWINEIDNKLRIRNNLKVYHFYGSKRNSTKTFLQQQDVIVTTYDILRGKGGNVLVKELHYSRVILDEGHIIHNRNNKTTKTMFQLNSYYRWIVTGTPMKDQIDNMYSFVKFIRHPQLSDRKKFLSTIRPYENHQKRKGSGIDVQRFFVIINKKKKKKEKKEKEKRNVPREKLNLILSKFILRRTEVMVKQQISLPERHYRIICPRKFEFRNEKRLINILYSRCQNFVVRLMEEGRLGKSILKVRNLTKVLQMALLHYSIVLDTDFDKLFDDKKKNDDDDYLEDEDEDEDESSESSESESETLEQVLVSLRETSEYQHSTKSLRIIEKIREILSKRKDDKILVWGQHQLFLDKLMKLMRNEKITYEVLHSKLTLKKKAEALNKLNTDPKVRVMFLNVQGSNWGLNLTKANHIIFCEPVSNPIQEIQAMYRIWRIGQNKEVYFYHCVISGTFEDRLLQLMKEKRKKIRGSYGSHRKELGSEKYTDREFKYLFELKDKEEEEEDDDDDEMEDEE